MSYEDPQGKMWNSYFEKQAMQQNIPNFCPHCGSASWCTSVALTGLGVRCGKCGYVFIEEEEPYEQR